MGIYFKIIYYIVGFQSLNTQLEGFIVVNIEMNYLENEIRIGYALEIKSLEPMDYGADSNAERFRLLDINNRAYFVKISKEVSGQNLELLHYLSETLGDYIITPIENHNAELYTKCENYSIIIYPFIEGKNGFEEALTLTDIQTLGEIIKCLHSLDAAYLKDKFGINQYIHNPSYRNQIRNILKTFEDIKSEDSLIIRLKDFVRSVAAQLNEILSILDDLNDSIINKDNILSICHTDIHVGNILKAYDEKLYIVDWDQVAIGPRELDLLFFGGGIAAYLSDESEIKSFYRGYGDCSIDYKKLAFYRFARIIEDIALFYQEIMDVTIDYEKRKVAFLYLQSNFNHNETIDCAFRTFQYVKE